MPKLAFAWASTWMLREIELRKMKIRDVTFPPTSKCDQEGRGIRRTDAKFPCAALWSWALGWKAMKCAHDKGALPSSPLFSPRDNLKETSKSGNIKAGKRTWARRSQATALEGRGRCTM